MIKIPACSALRACLVWQGRELHFIMLCGMWITLRFVWRLKIKNDYFFKDIPYAIIGQGISFYIFRRTLLNNRRN